MALDAREVKRLNQQAPKRAESRREVVDGREWLVSPAGRIAVDQVDRLVTLFARSLRRASSR